MSLIQTLTDLFDSIFKRSSPEYIKKQEMKKLEAEIRAFTPFICKDGLLQPNFGEGIYALYKNTRVLDNLFSVTISQNDIPRQHRFEAQLLFTGFSPEAQTIIEELDFSERKLEVLNNYDKADRIFLHQKNQMEKVLKELNSDIFKKMDNDILNLRQLVDICHYNFTPFLQIFDSNFEPANMMYQPNYSEVEASKAINLLEDLYYQSCGIRISSVTLSAVLALAKLRNGGDLSEDEKEVYVSALKKINYVFKNIFTELKIKAIIQQVKNDTAYEPKKCSYTGSPRQEFAAQFKTKYEADEQRIKTELQDEKISSELNALFPSNQLEEVESYNQKTNELLQSNTSLSLMWILPLRILKTFLSVYVPNAVKSLLNDIVIEGFFNNPSYKSNFSTVVYSVINAHESIEAFENSFKSNQKNSIAVLESYIRDGKKDKDFYKKLEKMVENINNDAHNLLQTEVTNLSTLYKELGEILEDVKKPSGEIITNLKVLVMSSRNRDNTTFLETRYPDWAIFFEIMKNYVIINSGEIQ